MPYKRKTQFLVECKICGKQFGAISNTHLKIHNITLNEYKSLYPDQKISSLYKMTYTDPPLCACGCGEKVKKDSQGYARWNKYIEGHSRIGKKNSKEQNAAISKANKGKKRNYSEEVEKERRRKIGEKLKGRKKTINEIKAAKKLMQDRWDNNREEMLEIAKKASSWTKGKTKYNDKRLMKISLLSKERTKEKSPNWKGGIDHAGYYYDFYKFLRHEIKERDNYTCQLCNKKERSNKLNVHHIDENKSNNERYNLITLCISCHKKFHTKKSDRLLYKTQALYNTKKQYCYIVNHFDNLNMEI